MAKLCRLGDAWDRTMKKFSLVYLHGRTLHATNKASTQLLLAPRDVSPTCRLEKLYFIIAARVLFTNPPKIHKFWSFHLVQFFFACAPSLAIYLAAKLARDEIKRMKAGVEQKEKTAMEVQKYHEMEFSASQKGDKMVADMEFLKMRVDALEVAMQEFVANPNKVSSGSNSNSSTAESSGTQTVNSRNGSNSVVIDASEQTPQEQNNNGGLS